MYNFFLFLHAHFRGKSYLLQMDKGAGGQGQVN